MKCYLKINNKPRLFYLFAAKHIYMHRVNTCKRNKIKLNPPVKRTPNFKDDLYV